MVTGGDGFPALSLEDRSFAWLGGSSVAGGRGGFAECVLGLACTALSGDGGPGAIIEPGSLCVELESSIRGGAPGDISSTADPATSSTGATGPAVIGTTVAVPGAQRRLDAPRSVRSGEPVPVTLTGSPGEEIMMVATAAGGHRFLGPLIGVVLANADHVLLPVVVGVVPASGVFETTVDLGEIGAGEARTVHLQAFLRTSPSRFRVTPVRQVTQLGSGVQRIEPVSRIYLDSSAAPGGDGLSWGTAANDLARVLEELPVGGATPTEVWFRERVYLAGSPSVPAPAAALYGDALHLLGGFDGTETSAQERDPQQHRVTVTGDLTGDDAVGGSRVDNARGLLAFGSASSAESHVSGITFEGAEGAPAVAIYGGFTVDGCIFRDNHAGSASAGALLGSTTAFTAHRFRLRSSIFEGNTAGASGAFLARVSHNLLGGSGLPAGESRIEVVGCLFSGNRAADVRQVAGAGYVQRGGAIDMDCGAECAEILSNTFVDNHAEATSSASATPGGVAFDRQARGHFHGNLCFSPFLAANPAMAFSFLDPEDDDEVSYNRVEVLLSGWNPMTHVTADPRFIDLLGPDGLSATGDEDFRLDALSPCIDAGDSTQVPTSFQLDLDGHPRFVDDPSAPNVGTGGSRIIDMGAYERQ